MGELKLKKSLLIGSERDEVSNENIAELGGDLMLWKQTLKIGEYTFLLKAQSKKKLDVRTSGASSRIPTTSLHVTFLDYDDIVDDRLVEELRFLQEEFEIGDFYVFETRTEGRHAICLDALRFKDVLEIVRFSNCDLMFKRGPMMNEFRTWVLRYSKKGKREAPKYLYKVQSRYEGKNLQSRSHANHLKINFGVNVDLQKPYGPEKVEIQFFKTGNRTEEDQK